MKTKPNDNNAGALLDVAVLDVLSTPGLVEELIPAFVRHRPAAAEWPKDWMQRIVFRTECRWGRVELEPGTVYLLSEMGGGPREPLGDGVVCRISVYAELPARGDREGFHDTEPFIDIAFDAEQAKRIPSIGFLRLEEFMLRRLEGVERAYLEWRRILEEATARIQTRREVACEPPIELEFPARKPVMLAQRA
jgi:hypothetical protein